jgi:hypothetical protein
MYKSFFLSFVAVIYISGCLAQSDFIPGYIIKPEMDTIFGTMDYRNDFSNFQKCSFRTNDQDSITIHYPGQIHSYRFNDGKYFISKIIPDKQGNKYVFMEYLIHGKINIYYFKDAVGDHYFIEKDSLPIKEISYSDAEVIIDDKSYVRNYDINRGVLLYYMQDCPELSERIKATKTTSHYDLINLAETYHNHVCKDEKCVIYEKKLPGLNMKIQPLAGTTKYRGYPDQSINPVYKGQYGLLVYLGLPLTSERIFIRTGLIYTQLQLEEDTLSGTIESSTQNNFKIPFQFQYLYTRRTLSPTFGGGMNIITPTFYTVMALNAGLNINLNANLHLMLLSEIEFRFVIIPESLLSYSFNLGLAFDL